MANNTGKVGNPKKGGSTKGKVLNHQQMVFIELYTSNGGKATEAARGAGYKHPGVVAFTRLLKSPLVLKEIEKRRGQVQKKHEITRDWVIERYRKFVEAFDTLAKFKMVENDGAVRWDFSGATQDELALITELATEYYTEGKGEHRKTVKKFKVGMVDPKTALDSIARIMGLFKDNVNHTGEVSLVDRIQKGRERAGAV